MNAIPTDSLWHAGYTLTREPIARGAQGAVYAATGPDGRSWAVKLAHPNGAACELVRREAGLLRLLARSGVGGLVDAVDLTHIDARPALVMPVYPQHLGAWLAGVHLHPGPLALDGILGHVSTVARTLGALHRARPTEFVGRQLVHRDVKPENILMDRKGIAHLGDFGSAIAVEGLRPVELEPSGTLRWAPLDQILPGRVLPGPTWDTYALCVILYAGIVGEVPSCQLDPRPRLTARGRAVWDAMRYMDAASAEERGRAKAAFVRERSGTVAADLIDADAPTLTDVDRQRLGASMLHLAAAAGVDASGRAALHRAVWALMTRGLSPLALPTPPNRYADADELADAIDDLRDTLARRGAAPAVQDARNAEVEHLLTPEAAPERPVDGGPVSAEVEESDGDGDELDADEIPSIRGSILPVIAALAIATTMLATMLAATFGVPSGEAIDGWTAATLIALQGG